MKVLESVAPAPAPARRDSRPAAVGVVDALLAAALYTAGWGRAFSYDGSRTVGQFVTPDSLGGVFQQDRFNNHPLFSLLEHLVYVVTHSADERLLRMLPIMCGALAVGLVAAAVAERFGTVAGHVAGSTMALNAMSLRQFREVRGYALVTLAAVLATLVLFKRLREPASKPGAMYVVALAAAIATHLFAAGVIALHAVVVLGSHPRRLRPWIGPWAAALGLGLIVQWPGVVDGLRAPPHHAFAPTFPVRLAANLLGGPVAPGMLVLVVVGLMTLTSRSWVRWAATATAILVIACWLAGPSWLDSRFFIWLVPAAAVAAGVGVARRPGLVFVAIGCGAVQLIVFATSSAGSDVPNRIASDFIRASQTNGASVCALGRTRAGLLAYVKDVPVVWDVAHLRACDVAVDAAGPGREPLTGAACTRFAYVLSLPARHPGAIFADRALPLAPEFVAVAGPEANGWARTTSATVCTPRSAR